MATFLEQKLAALDAAQRRSKRIRLLAAVAVACFTAVPLSGQLWLAAPGLAALVAALMMRLRSSSSRPAASAADSTAEANQPATAAAPAHPLPEPAGAVREGSVEWSLELTRPLRLRTERGEDVLLGAGSHPATLRLSHPAERPAARDAIDHPRCDFRVRGDDGSWWQTRTYLDPDTFTRPLERADRPIHLWEDAPPSWKIALAENCLLTGVRQLLDSRERIELPVGDRSLTIMFKHQGPELDFGWLDEERQVVVRVAAMHYETWEDGEFRDIVDQVTFAYLLEPRELAPLLFPENHWPTWGAWETDTGEERLPPVFAPSST